MREIRKTEQKRTPSKQRKGSIEITEKMDNEMGRVECGRNRVKRESRDEGRMQRQQKNVAMEAFWRER
ncbi:unknown [Bacteroides sp. CAG:709]|nr:unknown [Bacteroides sp. CAG:709]